MSTRMVHRKALSKVIAAGLVAGASCFAQRDTFLKLQQDGTFRTIGEPGQALSGRRENRALIGDLDHQGAVHLPFVTATTLHAQSVVKSSLESSDRMATSYNLIWSKGFLQKFGFVTATLLSLHWTGIAGRIGIISSRIWHTHLSGQFQNVLATCVPNVVLPLLSSSCCLLQLMINALVGAGGCAGFNTVLGPVRPAFLSVLAYLNWTSRPPLGTAVVRLSLALLPEMVHFWNIWLLHNWRTNVNKSLDTGAEALYITVEVDIPTMGCVACVNKIDTSLRQSNTPVKVVEASSWLDGSKEKGGRARVRMALNSKEDLESVKELILKSIDGAGFPGSSIVDVQMDGSTEPGANPTP